MKIPVPEYVLKHDKWNDRDMVLFSLLFYFYSLDNRLGIRYYMQSVDVKRILDCLQSAGPQNHIQKFRSVLRVGIASWDVWTFEFNPKPEDKTRNGRIEKAYYDIQDTEAIGLFYYLAGRLTAPGIITDDEVTYDNVAPRGRKIGMVMNDYFSNPMFYESRL